MALAARLDVVRRVNQALGGDSLALDQVSSLLSRGQAALPASGLCIVIDPIDGTKGFIRGDQYAVALGLIDDGVPTAGVLGCPNLTSHDGARVGCLFAAMRGQGAHEFLLDGTPSCTLAAGTAAPQPVRMLESYEASHFVGEAHARIARACNVVETVRYDSQVKYGVLARGGACIMPRVTTHDNCVWDIAPGAAILAEAGGRVTDAAGQPLVYVALSSASCELTPVGAYERRRAERCKATSFCARPRAALQRTTPWWPPCSHENIKTKRVLKFFCTLTIAERREERSGSG